MGLNASGLPETFRVGETSGRKEPEIRVELLPRAPRVTRDTKQRRGRSSSVNTIFTLPSSLATLVSPHAPSKASFPRRVNLPLAVPLIPTSNLPKLQLLRTPQSPPRPLSSPINLTDTPTKSHKPSRSSPSDTTTSPPSFNESLPYIPSSLRLSRKKSKVALRRLHASFGASSVSSSSDVEDSNSPHIIPSVPAPPIGLSKLLPPDALAATKCLLLLCLMSAPAPARLRLPAER